MSYNDCRNLINSTILFFFLPLFHFCSSTTPSATYGWSSLKDSNWATGTALSSRAIFSPYHCSPYLCWPQSWPPTPSPSLPAISQPMRLSSLMRKPALRERTLPERSLTRMPSIASVPYCYYSFLSGQILLFRDLSIQQIKWYFPVTERQQHTFSPFPLLATVFHRWLLILATTLLQFTVFICVRCCRRGKFLLDWCIVFCTSSSVAVWFWYSLLSTEDSLKLYWKHIIEMTHTKKKNRGFWRKSEKEKRQQQKVIHSYAHLASVVISWQAVEMRHRTEKRESRVEDSTLVGTSMNENSSREADNIWKW